MANVSTSAVPAVKQKSPVETLRNLFNNNKDQLSLALPKYMNVDRLIRVAITCCQRTPGLLECAPVTLLGALFGCGQLGLEPDPITGEAYLVPFMNNKKNRKEVQLIVGYRGLIKLATNTDQVSHIYAREVYAKDEFSYEYGTNPYIKHKQSNLPLKDRGGITHFYAVAKLSDGNVQFEVMTKEDVDAIRARSKAGSSGPWVTDYVEMGRKTPTRRLCKYLPKSASNSKLLFAVGIDERHDIGKPQDLGLLTNNPTETATPEVEEKPEAQMPQEKPVPVWPKDKDGEMLNDAQEPVEAEVVSPMLAKKK